MRIGALALLLASAVAACGPSGRPVDPPAPATGAATPTPSPTPSPAPSPPPPASPTVRAAVAREPSGPTPLSPSVETVVDPAATFEVELAGRLADARIVLLDAADAHVAVQDVREVAATTRLTLAPSAPLTPGSRYLLRVDGASVREMHDAGGRAFAPVGYPILVAGAPPPPAPKAPARKKRRR